MSDSDPYGEHEEEYEDQDEEEDQSRADLEEENESKSDSESESRSASSSPSPVLYTLEDAIASAPTDQIRDILSELCDRNEFARDVVTSHLLAPLNDIRHRVGFGRKVFAKCKNCSIDYNTLENAKGDCVYHPGVKEVDDESDFWADHDPDCHGDPEDFYDDPDFQDGFAWDCCNHIGSSAGCVRSKHKPEPVEEESPVAKRRRYH